MGESKCQSINYLSYFNALYGKAGTLNYKGRCYCCCFNCQEDRCGCTHLPSQGSGGNCRRLVNLRPFWATQEDHIFKIKNKIKSKGLEKPYYIIMLVQWFIKFIFPWSSLSRFNIVILGHVTASRVSLSLSFLICEHSKAGLFREILDV